MRHGVGRGSRAPVLGEWLLFSARERRARFQRSRGSASSCEKNAFYLPRPPRVFPAQNFGRGVMSFNKQNPLSRPLEFSALVSMASPKPPRREPGCATEEADGGPAGARCIPMKMSARRAFAWSNRTTPAQLVRG